jgi:hypothetical protein
MNKIIIAPIIGMMLAILTKLGVALPPQFSQAAILSVTMMIIAAWTAFTRFESSTDQTGFRLWHESRTIWTAIITAGLGVAGLFGFAQGLDVDGAVSTVMFVTSLAATWFGRGPQKLIV